MKQTQWQFDPKEGRKEGISILYNRKRWWRMSDSERSHDGDGGDDGDGGEDAKGHDDDDDASG